MKIFDTEKQEIICVAKEIGVCTDEGEWLFNIRLSGNGMDVVVAGDDGDKGDYGQLAITPLSSRRLTVWRDRRTRARS